MFKYILFILYPIISFSFVRYGFIDRKFLDLSLFIFVLSLCFFKKRLWFLVIAVTLFNSWQIKGLDDYLWLLNFTIIGIVLLDSKDNLIPLEIINNFSPFLVLLIFSKTIFDIIIGDFVEGGDRIAGPFTSSLHLAYFCVIYSFILAILKSPLFLTQIFLLLLASIVSGSRVGAVGVFIVFFLQLSWQIRIAFISFSLIFVLFNGIPEVRVLSYIPDAEDVRFGGFIRYFSDTIFSDPLSSLFGYGRKNYGAVGYRLFGEDVFITESSLIMLLYCYGLILGTYIFYYLSSSIIMIGRLQNQLFSSIVIVLFIIFSPFIDSPAIFFVNMTLLASVSNPIRIRSVSLT